MSVRIEKSNLYGSVTPPSAKSYAHRAIFAAAASGRRTKIKNVCFADDINATVNCMRQLGCSVECGEDSIFIDPTGLGTVDGVLLDANESGTTLRFLLPLVCTLGIEARIIGKGRLASRPMTELVNALACHGAVVSGEGLPLTANGKIAPGEYCITGEVSSQYVSGLMTALSSLDGESHLRVTGKRVSNGYVDMTVETLKAFDIGIQNTDDGYHIMPNSNKSDFEFMPESDWSACAFWLVAGALGGDIYIDNMNENSLQPDMRVLSALRQMGAKITREGNLYQVTSGSLTATEFDVTACPDLAPILSVAMACAEGTSRMYGVDRLRDKESDRLAAICSMLRALSTAHAYRDGMLEIVGGHPRGSTIDGFSDHRMVMSGVVVGSLVGGVTVTDEAAVSKSYPRFFDDLRALGGKYEFLR